MLLTKSLPWRGRLQWRLDVVGCPEEVLAHLAEFVGEMQGDRKWAVPATQAMHAVRLYVGAQSPDRTVRMESRGNNVDGVDTVAITLTSYVEAEHVRTG